MSNIRLDNKCNYKYSEIDNMIEKIRVVREDVICSFEASRNSMQGGLPSDFMRDKLRSLKSQKNMTLLDIVLSRLSHATLLMEYNAKLSGEGFFSAMVGSDALKWSHDTILNDLCASIDAVTNFITYGDVNALHKTVLYDVIDTLNRIQSEYV